jgi:hypothetical protein
VNPYAEQLTFASDRVRLRRDHVKYLALIDAIALLHQHQREVKTLERRGQAIARWSTCALRQGVTGSGSLFWLKPS